MEGETCGQQLPRLPVVRQRQASEHSHQSACTWFAHHVPISSLPLLHCAAKAIEGCLLFEQLSLPAKQASGRPPAAAVLAARVDAALGGMRGAPLPVTWSGLAAGHGSSTGMPYFLH